MELNHYKLIFDNNKEFLVSTDIDNTKSVVDRLDQGYGYIIVQMDDDSEPLYISRERLFSVEKVTTTISKSYNKVWRLK